MHRSRGLATHRATIRVRAVAHIVRSASLHAMRFHGIACDYDGTIAHHGRVADETLAALERVRASGRKLVLVTGRHLEDLQTVFDRLDVFDRAVVENGAVIYDPAAGGVRTLGEPPATAFIDALA